MKLSLPTSMIKLLIFGAMPVMPTMLTKMLTDTKMGTILARLTPPSYNASSMLRRLALIPFTGISVISISIMVERQV